MLPRTHIVLGAGFTLLLWVVAPSLSPFYLLLIFLSSFLIDFDHYLVAVKKTKKLSLRKALDYYESHTLKSNKEHAAGKRNKGDFHIFHTLEFHMLVGIIGIVWQPIFYIFIGMVFHSLLDLGYMVYTNRLYRREFFFTNWLIEQYK